MQVSVLIVLQNDGPRLMALLESLVAHTSDGDYEVVVVDRGSSDGTNATLASLSGDLKVLRGDSSLSFSDAVRAAVPHLAHEHVVLTTGGAMFAAGWFETLLPTRPDDPLNAVSDLQPLMMTRHALQQLFAVSNSVTSVEPHALGHATGNALNEVMAAAREAPAVGDLPVAATEMLRERLQAEEEHRLLLHARAGRDVCWIDENETEPLVTVRVATSNRVEQLMELAIPAILDQSYERLDVLVIGDNADDDTAQAVASIRDSRVRFVNLPGPYPYPDDPWLRWLIAGAPAVNAAIDLANGSWITSTDDDDEMTADHVEVLLRHAQQHRLEFVWSKTLMETLDGWQVRGGPQMVPGATTSASVIWSLGLRFMKESTTCWKLNEPQDGNLWRRMSQVGVKMGFCDHITYRYYMGGNMRMQQLQGSEN